MSTTFRYKSTCVFSKGATRVGFQTVLSVTQYFSYKKKLDFFRSYPLVEADLLVCKPAPGDRIEVDLMKLIPFC